MGQPANEDFYFTQGETWAPDLTFETNAQLITLPSGYTGSVVLSFHKQPTVGLTEASTELDIQTALRALSSIGAGQVDVSGAVGGPFTVDWQGDLAKKEQKLLDPTPVSITVTQIPIDLTGYSAQLMARVKVDDASPLIDLSTTAGGGNGKIAPLDSTGAILPTLSAMESAALSVPAIGLTLVYDLRITKLSTGVVTYLMSGKLYIREAVTR